ncbi:MAG TPA: monovalent cation/H+ antiporter complex subunit F [Opitutales bacterium]|nr:monovalent cation/H+ antiporter complex subunit F [Opitutales bacterium]
MFSEATPFSIQIALILALILLLAAFALALLRIGNADSAFDRVVALDLVGGICLCFLVVFAIGFEQQILLDSAFALAVMSYLGTVAFARYLEKGRMK